MTAPLTDRFDSAFLLTSSLHREQLRKGTDIPYLAHLMAVAAIVLEAGGDEDLAIAALLHDAVEDQGGQPTLETIRQKFGDRVAGVVSECSDTDIEPKPPWRARKEAYIEHLATGSADAVLVSLADKLHNARTILADFRAVGDQVWKRFRASKAEVLWYYRELGKVFQERTASPLTAELTRVIGELDAAAAMPMT
ncbi:MAG: HD domain-containing protein [Acidobacteriaceae bacterium]|nr:HD domain-containing protein [Acidobacteriaceae bacterium]